jgi:hypothetical protein
MIRVFTTIAKLYVNGRITIKDLDKAVKMGLITEEEKDIIIKIN